MGVAIMDNKQGRNYAKRVSKGQSKPKPVRKCLMCQKLLKNAHGAALYCGNRRKGTGCAWIHKLRYDAKWKSNIKYHKRPDRRAKQRFYEKRAYWKEKGVDIPLALLKKTSHKKSPHKEGLPIS